MDVLTASYEGVNLLDRDSAASWSKTQLGTGNQDEARRATAAPARSSRASSGDGRRFIATIEPWHGNQVVVYTPPARARGCGTATSSTTSCKWGHAVWCADLDGDGDDELIIGVRDNLSRKPGEQCGVRIYKALDDKGTKWERHDDRRGRRRGARTWRPPTSTATAASTSSPSAERRTTSASTGTRGRRSRDNFAFASKMLCAFQTSTTAPPLDSTRLKRLAASATGPGLVPGPWLALAGDPGRQGPGPPRGPGGPRRRRSPRT